MAKALYRKYRPKTLADVVGQAQVTDVLAQAIKQDKLSHAYLFTGPRGTGKTSVARIFAHEINHFKYELEDEYLDIIEIDAASNTGVDNIRELREKAVIAPSQGKYKIYIIDEVHMLSKSAFNALLKTLEEPPEHVIFIMATTDAFKIPVTITSRAQTYTFKLADADTMFKHLQSIVKAEKIAIDDDALKLVVRRGGGSFRDTLSLLDQISTLSKDKITAEMVAAALGLPEEQIIRDLLDCYKAGDLVKISAALKNALSSGVKPEILAEEVINQIIAAPEPDFLPLLAKLPEVKDNFPEAKLLLAFVQSAPVDRGTAPRLVVSRMVTTVTQPATPAVEAAAPVSQPTVAPVEPAPAPEESSAPASAPTPVPQGAGDFNLDGFIDAVKQKSTSVSRSLTQATCEIIDTTLHVYPARSFDKKILDKPTSAQVLTECSGGLAVVIHEFGQKTAAKDESLGSISAIMGDIQEVNNGGGAIPF